MNILSFSESIMNLVMFLMKGNQRTNFILSESITKVIFTISVPLMLNNIVMTMYNLVDGLFVAQLSPEDFAATAFIWPLHFLFIAIGMGVGVGGTALLSQFIGAERMDTAHRYASNMLLIVLSLATLFSIFGFLAAPWMLSAMGATGTLYDKSLIYLQINFLGIFFDFIYFAYQAMLNSQGLTKDITFISIISSVVNIILDPIFIFEQVPLIGISGLGMGIAGAAWATVISKVVLLILAVIVVTKDSQVPLTIRRDHIDSTNFSNFNSIRTRLQWFCAWLYCTEWSNYHLWNRYIGCILNGKPSDRYFNTTANGDWGSFDFNYWSTHGSGIN